MLNRNKKVRIIEGKTSMKRKILLAMGSLYLFHLLPQVFELFTYWITRSQVISYSIEVHYKFVYNKNV